VKENSTLKPFPEKEKPEEKVQTMFENENVFQNANYSTPFMMPAQTYDQNQYDYYDDDACIKYTCRFDIQIPNDKEF